MIICLQMPLVSYGWMVPICAILFSLRFELWNHKYESHVNRKTTINHIYNFEQIPSYILYYGMHVV